MSDTYIRYPNMSWKAPVANAGALPMLGNSPGDARVALATDTIYLWTGSTWVAVAGPGAATAIDALTGDVSATGPGTVPATVNFVGGSSAADVNSATQIVLASDPNSVAFFDGAGQLSDDPNVRYSPSIVQTFPPFAARGFYADSDAINSNGTGFVFSSLDTSTDSFTTNLGMITGANNSVAASNPTGGVVIATGSVSDPGATANTGAINLFTGPNNAAGASGGIIINSGQTTDGPSGAIGIFTGGPSGIGGSGSISVSSGSSNSGNSGSLNLKTGTSSSGPTGDIQLSSGNASASSSGGVLVSTGDATGASGFLEIKSGTSTTGFSSGAISAHTGNTDDMSSGALFLTTGGSNTGNTGNIQLQTGVTTDGNSGDNVIGSGNSTNGASGVVSISSGQSSTNSSGQINIQSGNSGNASGALQLGTGTAGAGFLSGAIRAVSGAADDMASGDILVGSGASNSGNSGATAIFSGDSTSGDSGSIGLVIGAAGGTRGKIKLIDGSEGTTGHVWTSTDTNGSGAWVNPANAVWSGAIDGTPTFSVASATYADFVVGGGTSTFAEYLNTGMGVVSGIPDNSGNGIYQPGISFTPPSTGVWKAEIDFQITVNSSQDLNVRITDDAGSITYDEAEYTNPGITSFSTSGHLTAFLNVTSLASPTTVKLQGAASAGTLELRAFSLSGVGVYIKLSKVG